MRTVPSNSRTSSQRGYILLAMLLFVALLAIAAAAIAPTIAFQVRRDHEEELIHRGVQYSRAVKHYFKKFNRYPTRIEDLESTNQFRFLRKAYKDPITGKDFKILYQSQVQAMGIGAGGGLAAAAVMTGGAAGLPASSFGGSSGATAKAAPVAGSGTSDDAGTGQTGSTDSGSTSPNARVTPGGTESVESGPATGKVFGGGPIVGVVSTSKAQSIREFNKKDHYNEWLFIYDPSTDTGGLLNTPAQPAIQGAVPAAGQSAVPSAAGSQFGNPGMGGTQSNPPGGTQPQQSAQP